MKLTPSPSPRLLAAAVLLMTYPLASTAGVPNRATLEQAKSAASAAPQAVAMAGATVLPPASVPFGKTYEEWSTIWWQWFLSQTYRDIGSCSMKRLGPVALVPIGMPQCSITVPSDTALFVNLGSVQCSDLELAPLHGSTPQERASCAASFVSLFTPPDRPLSLEIDDVPVPNLISYRFASPDFPFVVGPENVFDIRCASPSCVGNAAAAGYYVMLAPLPPGVHNVRISNPGFEIDSSFRVSVEPGREGNAR